MDGACVEQNTASGTGGGIYVSPAGSLELIDSTVDGNQAGSGGGIFGHFNEGQRLRISGSTISNNTASGSGGGLNFAEWSDVLPAVGTVVNSTFSGNSAANGGGIYARYGLADLTIINCTIADNHVSGGGGGVYLADDGIITLRNTVVADNAKVSGSSSNITGAVNADSSYNLVGPGGGSGDLSSSDGKHNIVLAAGQTAGLAPLGDYGGPTKTHGLLAGSPALDAGSDDLAVDLDGSPLLADQRGNQRPFDLSGVSQSGSSVTDIGAYEAGSPAVLVVNVSDDEFDDVDAPDFDFGDVSLREALALAQRLAGPDEVRFAPDGRGELALQASLLGPLVVDSEVVIAGPGPQDLTINANGAENVFYFPDIDGMIDVTLRGLGLTGSNSAAICEPNETTSTLTLEDMDVSGNLGDGLQLYNYESSVVTVAKSRIRLNQGSAVEMEGNGTLTIVDSEISDNDAHALHLENVDALVLTDSSLAYNGGGIGWCDVNDIFIAGSEIFGNGSVISGEGSTHLDIIGSTIADNDIGIHLGDGTANIVNTTISGNRDGGVIVDADADSVTLTNVTITNNRGVGVSVASGPTVTLQNSIVAGNLLDDAHPSTPNDVAGAFSTGSSHNLIGWIDGSTGLTEPGSGTQYGGSQVGDGEPLDPRLAPLGDYGGPTRTHALLLDSRAIDAGDVAFAGGLATDQRGRGFRRNVGGGADVGAFESQGIPDQFVVNTVLDVHDATLLGDGIVDVDLSTPGRQVSLRAAIEEAEALDQIESRTYVIAFDPTLAGVIDLTTLGTLTVSCDLRIEGPGADRVSLEGSHSVRLLRTTGTANLEITDLTLSGGKATGSDGGAILHDSTGTLTLDSAVITDSSADEYGGAIYTSHGLVQVVNSTLSENTARSGGALGIAVTNGACVIIEDSLLRNNDAIRDGSGGYGGALYVLGTADPAFQAATIDNTIFEENTSFYGGAVYQSAGSASIVDSQFTDNVAVPATDIGRGGAICFYHAGVLTLDSSSLTDNASGHGGGIYLRESSLDLVNCQIENNEAANLGGAVFSYGATLNASGSAIDVNHSAGDGGGIYADGSTLSLTDVEMTGNDAVLSGGGVYLTGATVTATTCEFSHNTANSYGGALCVYGSGLLLADAVLQGNTSPSFGGAVYFNGGTLEATDSTFAANEAGNGGGIYATVNDADSLTFERSTFSDNDAHQTGGGMFVSGGTLGEVSIFDSTVDRNRATYAGGIYAVPGILNIVGAAITNNVADVADNGASGGGLYIEGSGSRSASITNSTISGNTAYTGGGAYLSGSGAVVTITNCTVVDNCASGAAGWGCGGGIRNYGTSDIVLHNTIVADNRADNSSYRDVRGDFSSSSSYNLIGYDPVTSNGLDNQPASGSHNRVGGEGGALAIDPRLAPLGNYGGRTLTHALLADSPALDMGSNSNIPAGITNDQRGCDRTVNYTGLGEIVDIGAVEMALTSSRLEADFNGDGRIDSAFYESATRSLVVSLNLVAGIETSVWATLPSPSEWGNCHVGDVNGDGRDDIIARRAYNSTVVIAVSEGNRFQVLPVTDAWGGAILAPWTEFYVGDFDGDGSDEVAGWSMRTGAADRWEVLHFDEQAGFRLDSGDTAWSTAIRGQGISSTITVGDVNRDGRDDLVAYDPSSSTWKVGLSRVFVGMNVFSTFDLGTWFDGHVTGSPTTGVVDVDGPYQEFLNIFSDVYNTVELELYPGLMKGIQATAETKAGNDWDQAALLVDRLKAAGFDADIASGSVRVDVAVLRDWLGVQTNYAAYGVIHSSLDGNAVPLDAAGTDISSRSANYINANVAKVQFTHAWVRANMPTAGGLVPVDLDPSWKFKDYQPGIDLSGLTSPQGIFDEFDYLAQDGDQLPVEYFEDQVMDYLVDHNANASLADVPHDGPIIQRQFSAIPAGWNGVTTYGTVTTYDNFQAIIDNPAWRDALTHQVTISLDRETSDNRVSGLYFSVFCPTLPEFLPTNSKYVDAQTATYQNWGGFDTTHGSVSRTTNSAGTPVIELRGTQYVVVRIPSGYQVTDNTCLRFDFESNGATNLERFIGLDHDDDYDSGSSEYYTTIGTDTYAPGSGVQQITLAIGEPYRNKTSSSANWIILALQHPIAGTYVPTSTYARYGNFVLYEAGTTTFDDGVFQQVGATTADVTVDMDAVTAGDQSFKVTKNSVLEFEFKSGSEGRLHAIGWDIDFDSSNDSAQLSARYQLHGSGTQSGYLTTYNNYSGTDWVTYSIPIGAGLSSSATVDLARLIFVTDAGANVNAESQFRNFRIREAVAGAAGTHWSQTFVVPSVDLSSIKVDYLKQDNAPGVTIDDTYRARLSVDGAIVVQGAPFEVFQLGDKAKLHIQHRSPSAFEIDILASSADKTYTRDPGQILAISFDANQYSWEHIVELQADLNDLLFDGDDVSDIDELLSYTGAKYWYDFNHSNEIIDGLLHTVGGQQWVGSGIVTSDPYLLEIPDEAIAHLQFPIVPHDMGVDLPNSTHSSIGVYSGGVSTEAFQLVGYNASALENAILEEVINSESVSTIRGLQRAYDNVRGVRYDGSTISRDAVQVFESVPNGSGRTVYFRGEIGTNVATPYDPNRTTQRSRLQLLSYEDGGLKNHVNEASGIADLLFQENGQEGAVGTIRVLVPRSRSQIGDGVDGWTGTVYVAEYATESGRVGSYIISPDDGTPTSGGYSSNVVKEPDPLLPLGTFTNYASTGDPVNVANGNMFRDEVDFRLANWTVPLDFTRHYDSQNNMDVGFGVGWVHSFTGVLYRDPESTNDNKIIWLRGDGQRFTFERDDENSNYEVPASLSGTFEVSQEGGVTYYAYRDKDGTQYWFDSVSFDSSGVDGPDGAAGHVVGRLICLASRNDDGVAINYESGTSLRVIRIESYNNAGRRLEIQYTVNTASVQPYDGGELLGTWTYNFTTVVGGPGNTTKRLASACSATDEYVTAPAVTQYAYCTDGPDARRGLIRQITEPNGQQHEFEYYANGRVFRVTDSKGYQQNFSYNLFRNITEFTDDCGNVETYIHQDNGLLLRQVHPDRSRLVYTWGNADARPYEEFLMMSSTDEVGATETFTYYRPSDLHTYRSTNQDVYRPGELKTSESKDDIVTEYEYWVSPDPNYQHISELSKIIIDPDGAAITTTFAERDDRGMLERVVDAEDNVTVREYYGYDSTPLYLWGQLKSETRPKGVEGDEAVAWQPLLDTFTVTGDTLSVELLTGDVPSQIVFADAIRIDRIDDDGVLTRVVDDDLAGESSDFRSHSGSFSASSMSSASCYGGDAVYFRDAWSEQAAASWIFTGLLPGVYRVSAHWPGSTSADPTTKYRIFDGLPGESSPTLATVDQIDASAGFNGYQTVYEYDTAGNVVAAVTEGLPSGQRVYDSRGNVVYEEDATGVATTSVYDVLGRLVSTRTSSASSPELPAVGTTTLSYDASGLLLSSTDALGRTTANQYDGKGNLVKQTYADGTSVTYEYDGIGNRTAITDELGRTTRFIYDARNRLIQTIFADGSSTRTCYDGASRVIQSTDELGRTTQFAYDKAGRLLVTEHELTYYGDAPTAVAAFNAYDALGRLTQQIDAEGNVTTYKYDDLGRVVETRVVKYGDNPDNPTQPPVYLSTTNYDANGNVADQVVYDVVGLAALGVTDFSEPTSLIGFHPNYVHVVVTSYDSFGRPVEVANADGTTTSTIYDAAGRVRYTIDELGHRTEYQYDEYGRLERTIAPDPDGAGPQESASTRYERDAFGNVTRQWQYFGDYNGDTDVEYGDQYFYDLRNRVVTALTKDNEHRTDVLFDVAGQVVATTDALGNTSYTRYDERGRATQQRLPDPDGSGPQSAPVTTYEYDAVGNIIATTDPLGNTTGFYYDSLNRLRDEWSQYTAVADDAETPGDCEFTADAAAVNWVDEDDALPIYGRDFTYWDSLTSTPMATWTFDRLDAGDYQVSMTWLADACYDNDATATVFVDGLQQGLFPATVDQRKPPADFQTVYGTRVLGWEVLSWSVGVAAGDTVTVQLQGHAGEYLMADAVRLDRWVTRSYTYDNNGNLLTDTDTLGRTTTYAYDELGRQTSVKLPDPDGAEPLGRPETRSVYDGYGNLIQRVETRGTPTESDDRTDTFQYDPRNRLIEETLDAGTGHENVTTTYEYDAVGNRTLVTDALGHQTRYRYDAADRLIDQYEDYSEGRPATPLQFTPADVISPYPEYYDGTCGLSPDGSALTFAGNAYFCAAIDPYTVSHRTVLEFDLQADEFPQLAAIGFDNDALAIQRYFELTGSNSYADYYCTEFRQEVLPDGTGHFHIPIGQYLTDEEKATGIQITRLSFYNEDLYCLSDESLPVCTFSNIRLYESDEVRTVYTYDTRGNLETTRTASDPRNITTRYRYDRFGQQTHEILDYRGPSERTYVTIYDAVGNVVADRNQSAGTETTYEYDNLYRLIKTTLPDPDGDPATPNGLVTTYAYDAAGRQIKQTNGEGESTYTDYNELGLPVTQVDGNGDQTRYRYDSEANLRAVTDADGNTTSYQYDRLDRVTTETDPLGHRATYEYDIRGDLMRATDRNSRVRGFAYDNLDRMTAEAWAADGVWFHVVNWGYDSLGRVIWQRDGESEDTYVYNTFEYDGLGRLVEERNYDPALPASDTRPEVRQTYDYGFVYDAALGAFVDQVTQTQYQRDAAGIDVPIADTVFEYDGLGQLEFESDTDADAALGPDVAAKQISFRYDPSGNLGRITRQGGELDGQWARQATTDYQYDDAGRVTSIDHRFGPLTTYTYAFDNASRITQFNTLMGATTADSRGFAYDDAGQLTAATGDTGESYAYDAAGNRTTADGQVVVTDAANRLTDDGTYTYQYDNEGNLIQRTLKSDPARQTNYTWDYRNRLVEVVEQLGTTTFCTVQYAYNADDQRVARTETGVGPGVGITTFYVYDGDNLSMTLSGAYPDAAVTHRYLYGPETDQVLTDEVFATDWMTGAEPVSDEVLWLLADHQGTIRDVVDSFGTLRKHVDYDSFGQITGQAFYDKTGELIGGFGLEMIDQLFYYTGQERDPETGLQLHGARWYDPRMGRFISEDPSGLATGNDANLYRYVGNSPLNFTDPTGLRQSGNPLYSLPSVTKPFSNISYTAPPAADVMLPGINNQVYPTPSASDVFAGPSLASSYDYYNNLARQTPTEEQLFQAQLNPHGAAVKVETVVSPRYGDYVRQATDYLTSTRFAAESPTLSVLTRLVGYANASTVDALAPPSDPSYLVTYADGTTVYHMGEGPSTGSLAAQTALLAPPVLSGASRPAGQLAQRTTQEAVTVGLEASTVAPIDATYRARLGSAISSNYKSTFFSEHQHLEGEVVVHHAIEQQVLTRYPGVIREAEIHSLENLRGIPKDINSELHLRQIRREWDQFYMENPNPTKQQLLQKATVIDYKYGKEFNPPVGRVVP